MCRKAIVATDEERKLHVESAGERALAEGGEQLEGRRRHGVEVEVEDEAAIVRGELGREAHGRKRNANVRGVGRKGIAEGRRNKGGAVEGRKGRKRRVGEGRIGIGRGRRNRDRGERSGRGSGGKNRREGSRRRRQRIRQGRRDRDGDGRHRSGKSSGRRNRRISDNRRAGRRGTAGRERSRLKAKGSGMRLERQQARGSVGDASSREGGGGATVGEQDGMVVADEGRRERVAEDVRHRREAATVGPERQDHGEHVIVVVEKQRSLHEQEVEAVRDQMRAHCLQHHREPGGRLAVAEVGDDENAIVGGDLDGQRRREVELLEEGDDGRQDKLVKNAICSKHVRADLVSARQLVAADVDAAELAAGSAEVRGHVGHCSRDVDEGALLGDGEDEGKQTEALHEVAAATSHLQRAVARKRLRAAAEAVDGEQRQRADEEGAVMRTVRPQATRKGLTSRGEGGAEGGDGEAAVRGGSSVGRLLGGVESGGMASRAQRKVAVCMRTRPVGEEGVALAAGERLREQMRLAVEEDGQTRLLAIVVDGAIVEETRLHENVGLQRRIPGVAQGKGHRLALKEDREEKSENEQGRKGLARAGGEQAHPRHTHDKRRAG